MKKNKYIMILVLIITVFSFNNEVNAAQELSCVYSDSNVWNLLEGKHYTRAVMLVQEKDGTIKIYEAEENSDNNELKVDSKNWMIPNNNDKVKFQDLKSATSSNGKILKKCPKYYLNDSNNHTDGQSYLFSDDTSGNYYEFKVVDNANHAASPTRTENDYEEEKQEQSNEILLERYGFLIGKFGTSKKDTTCVYSRDGKSVQLDYDENELFVSTDFVNKNYEKPGYIALKFSLNDLEVDNCPMDVFVSEKTVGDVENGNIPVDSNGKLIDVSEIGSIEIALKSSDLSSSGQMYPLKSGKDFKKPILLHERITIASCEDILGEDGELLGMVKFIKNVVFIFIPIIAIGLGSLDIAKAIFSSSEDEMKKAQTKFIKRVIIAVIIFLLPAILRLLLEIANVVWGNIDTTLCGIF